MMLSLLAILVSLLLGTGIAFQTVINAKLSKKLQSPFLTSFVSFLLGTIGLLLILLIQHQSIVVDSAVFTQSPWWVWTGGLLAMFGLTINILIFPRLGSVQTALMPLLGQVSTGILIDSFGWLNAPYYDFTFARFIGLVLVLLGAGFVILSPKSKQNPMAQSPTTPLWIWRIFGIAGGVAAGITPAVNSTLGKVLSSGVLSALVPLATGTLALAIIVSLKDPKSWRLLKIDRLQWRPIWQWSGGLLGAVYVFGVILVVPMIGTGTVIVASLFGLLSGSLIIDHFGLFGTTKNRINFIKILGLMLLLSGIIFIQFSK